MSRVSAVLMLVAILFLVPVAAQATMIFNQTTPATIFSDNFEGGTVGSAPVASVGSWSIGTMGVGNSITVEDFSTTGISAYEGDQFLQLHSVGKSFPLAKGIVTSGSSNSGDVLKLDLACMVTEGSGSGIYFATAAGTFDFAIALVGPDGDANIFTVPNSVYRYSFANTAWTLVPGITLSPTAWNTVSITHTNGTTTATIEVNGTSFAGDSGSTTAWGQAWVGPNIGGMTTTSYIDAIPVPEPSTMALLASGLIGLLAYAWRKRK